MLQFDICVVLSSDRTVDFRINSTDGIFLRHLHDTGKSNLF